MTDITILLDGVKDAAGKRELRLFACAVARQVFHLLEDARSEDAIAMAERHADGEAPDDEWAAASDAARAARAAAWAASDAARAARAAARAAAKETQAAIFHDIIGERLPLRCSPDAQALALAAYGTRSDDGKLDPTLVGILADTLEDESHYEEVAHLRAGPHWRGCVVIDRVLGKTRS